MTNVIHIPGEPSIKDFVKNCFANNNILLTACKDEDIDPNIRDCVALFADGQYYASYEASHIDSHIKRRILEEEHKDFVYQKIKFVSQSYIDALYDEAKKYSWYISKDEQKQKYDPASNKIDEMNKYIENLFSTRKCLSVTDLVHPLYIGWPDSDKYALFSDGLLLISNKSKKSDELIEKFSKIYNDIELKVELVPDCYISAIYSNLPRYQRSATEIFMEMLKERAKKIAQELSIPYLDALEIVTITLHHHIDYDFDSYKSIKIESEAHARYLITDFKCAIINSQTYMNICEDYFKFKGIKYK